MPGDDAVARRQLFLGNDTLMAGDNYFCCQNKLESVTVGGDRLDTERHATGDKAYQYLIVLIGDSMLRRSHYVIEYFYSVT